MKYKKIIIAVILTLSQLIMIPHDGVLPFALFILIFGIGIPYRIVFAGVFIFLYWTFIILKVMNILDQKTERYGRAIKYLVEGTLFVVFYFIAVMILNVMTFLTRY